MKRQSEQRLSGKKHAEQDARGDFESTTVQLPQGINRFKLENTKPRRIDIIPYVVGVGNPMADKGELHVERTYYSHRNIGPEGKPYLCLAKTFKKKCPICEESARLLAADSDSELGKQLRPSKRQLWNVFDLDDPESGYQLWDISHFYFGAQLTTAVNACDEDEDYEYYADPESGYTLKLGIEENTFGGRKSYKVVRVDFKPRKKQYKRSVAKEMPCLDDLLIELPYEKLKKVFLQTPDAEDDDSDDSGSSSKKKDKKMKRKAVTAKSLGLSKGDSVSHDSLGDCVIKLIAKDGFTVTLEDEDGDIHAGIGVSELEIPKKGKKAAPAKKAPAKGKKKVEEEDEDEDDDDESDDEDEDDDEDDDESDDDDSDDEDDEDDDDDSDDDDDEDDDSDDEDDDDEESDDDDEDDEEEDDDDEDDDEDEPPVKKKAPAKKKK